MWPFDRTYMQLALAAGLVVGLCAPLIGTFLVHKRQSLMGDGIGHLAFAGVAAGLLLEVWPVWGALGVAVAGALAIEWLRSRGTTSGDLALAVFFYGGLAAGVVMSGLSSSLNASLLPYLFGAILTVSPGEVWIIAALGAVIAGSIALAGPALFAVVVDDESARVAGLPVGGLNAALSVLTAVTVVVAMRVVGVLLVAALMVLPVAAAQSFARSFRRTVLAASAIGAVSVVAGLAAARAWGLAPGGTIVLVATGVFGVAALAAGTRGRAIPAGAPHGH